MDRGMLKDRFDLIANPIAFELPLSLGRPQLNESRCIFEVLSNSLPDHTPMHLYQCHDCDDADGVPFQIFREVSVHSIDSSERTTFGIIFNSRQAM